MDGKPRAKDFQASLGFMWGFFSFFLPFARSAPALAHDHPPMSRAEGAEDEAALEVPGTPSEPAGKGLLAQPRHLDGDTRF